MQTESYRKRKVYFIFVRVCWGKRGAINNGTPYEEPPSLLFICLCGVSWGGAERLLSFDENDASKTILTITTTIHMCQLRGNHLTSPIKGKVLWS